MKSHFWIALLILAILGSVAQIWLDWWILGPLAFIAGAARQWTRTFDAFLLGFLGGMLSWAWLLIGRLLGQGNLAEKVAELFSLGETWALVLITLLIIGVFAGLAGLAGVYARISMQPTTAHTVR